MTAHLLYLTIGPVQDFIAQARRSRDLWYGSHLLSELSRCVARAIAARGGDLIFPALKNGDPELEECRAPTRETPHPNKGEPPLTIANIILAKVPEGRDPQKLAEEARGRLQEFWSGIADDVKKNCGGLIAPDIDAAWTEQIGTFLELSAAWTPITTTYADARKAVAKAIAARKNLRDFEPWKNQRGSGGGVGVPKSSLDGARETVLAEPGKRLKTLVKKYRIGEGEQLDAVGLVKRAGGETKESREKNDLQFVPIINVALGPWLNAAKAACKHEFEQLQKEVGGIDLARVTRNLPCVKSFPFDASIFLENRVWPTFKEQGLKEDDFTDPNRPDRENEKAWKDGVQLWEYKNLSGKDALRLRLREKGVRAFPFPYVACLVADGDGMGKAIDKIAGGSNPQKSHFEFSEKLAKFADAARKIVESEEHLGSLVYSGGDDVLAFLPLSRALACAEALRLEFATIMKDACKSLPEEEPRPTLSVGLGIGHVLDGMGDLLNIGRAAEKLAKGGHLPKAQRRNALAVIVDKRSGGTRSWRAQWDKNPAERLGEDARLLGGRLSTRKVFEIAETLRRFPKPEPEPGGIWPNILADDVTRSLKRTDGGESELMPQNVGLDLGGAGYSARHNAASDWIDRVLIAKTLADADPRNPEAAAKTLGEAA